MKTGIFEHNVKDRPY